MSVFVGDEREVMGLQETWEKQGKIVEGQDLLKSNWFNVRRWKHSNRAIVDLSVPPIIWDMLSDFDDLVFFERQVFRTCTLIIVQGFHQFFILLRFRPYGGCGWGRGLWVRWCRRGRCYTASRRWGERALIANRRCGCEFVHVEVARFCWRIWRWRLLCFCIGEMIAEFSGKLTNFTPDSIEMFGGRWGGRDVGRFG